MYKSQAANCREFIATIYWIDSSPSESDGFSIYVSVMCGK